MSLKFDQKRDDDDDDEKQINIVWWLDRLADWVIT